MKTFIILTFDDYAGGGTKATAPKHRRCLAADSYVEIPKRGSGTDQNQQLSRDF